MKQILFEVDLKEIEIVIYILYSRHICLPFSCVIDPDHMLPCTNYSALFHLYLH